MYYFFLTDFVFTSDDVIMLLWQLRCQNNTGHNNFHLYLIQLWWSFFDGIVNDGLVSSQTWVVLPLKNPVEPP